VNLNVGGTHQIMTNMGVLSQVKESKLSQMFSNTDGLPKMPDGNTIFIDRDGPTFSNLINYLRNDREEYPIFENTSDQHLFYKELKYWEFPEADYM
tara:strand:+ start:302 stop:589 length:288 start_codon:yes stop_codon:yes gene_type:complete